MNLAMGQFYKAGNCQCLGNSPDGKKAEVTTMHEVKDHYIAQWVPATTRAPHRTPLGQLVYIKEHHLSRSAKNVFAGFAQKWSGLHQVVKSLGYMAYLIWSRRRMIAIH
ncbi:hypothetical protein PR048_016580 [Dryococelus australis]|uniref:Uncharacterized protein n=1 Tax=Dryococelus australis TaxID=614101 RepID=A0ABQ9HKG3_9NEOP|nr:hypothetical protein PR048_016580 [Dryococelus australis]